MGISVTPTNTNGSSGSAPPTAQNGEVERLTALAQAATSYPDALLLAADAASAELLETMKAARVQKCEPKVEALRRSGLHVLLLETMLRGALSEALVKQHLTRMQDAIRARLTPVQDLKNGILAFDEICQQLALVIGKDAPFHYPLDGNRARDLLITYARSLHR